jgi:hypothetical protein
MQQMFTKHGIRQRCQQRNAQGMASKRIVTRQLEQIGRMKKKILSSYRYQGYVLRAVKGFLEATLLGNYDHTDHSSRPKDPAFRRLVHWICTHPRAERWVVNLIHQSIEVVTTCIREFMAHSINCNLPLLHCVGDLMKMDAYLAATQRTAHELRAYFMEHLTQELFTTLPKEPCSLQRFYTCGRQDCRVPCCHKFMKAKEVKTSASAVEDLTEGVDEMLATLIEEMSVDRAIVVQSRSEEVTREAFDAHQERLSGWKWKGTPFHTGVNELMSRMEVDASSLSYSRPWKLDVLFGARHRKGVVRPELDPTSEAMLREIVKWVGPVGAGEPMARIVPFLPVTPPTREVLMQLVGPALRQNVTEKALHSYMSQLEAQMPHAAALLRRAWEMVCDAEDHFLLQDLPLNLLRSQLEAIRDVYHGLIPCDSNISFVFCPRCHTVYTHLVDDSVLFRKTFRYGLDAAAYQWDPKEGAKHFCTRKNTATKQVCDERLVFLPLVGRVLRWKKNTLVALCCQPRCARFTVLDRDKETLWNSYGFGCYRCLLASSVASSKRFSHLEYLFGPSTAPPQCSLIRHHMSDRLSRRFKDNLLHILAPQVFVCHKCYAPSMGERARKVARPDIATLTEIIEEEDDTRTREREDKRRTKLILRASRQKR